MSLNKVEILKKIKNGELSVEYAVELLTKKNQFHDVEKECVYFHPCWESENIEEIDYSDKGTLLLFDLNEDRFHELKNGLWNGHVVLVKPANEFKENDSDIFSLNPHSLDHYIQLFEKLGEHKLLPSHILHCWTLAVMEDRQTNDEHLWYEVERDLEHGLHPIFLLVKVLIRVQLDQECNLIFTYREDNFTPICAAVDSFSQVASLESSKLRLQVVQYTKEVNLKENLGSLLLEFSQMGKALGEICVTSNGRWRRKLKEFAPEDLYEEQNKPMIQPEGVYLVTGGLGGIGQMFVDHLAKQQSVKIAIVGRSLLEKKGEEFITELRNVGAEVEYYSADVSHLGEMSEVIEKIRERFGSLRGVIHMAGILEDNIIGRKEWASFKRVLSPKVAGTMIIDEVTKNEPLDFFTAFSSIASFFPNMGQSDYSAANRFVDEFLIKRQALVEQGERLGQSFSINWPLWKGGGMEMPPELSSKLREDLGFEVLSRINGLEAIDKMWKSKISQVGVLYGEPGKLRRLITEGWSQPSVKVLPSKNLDASVDFTQQDVEMYLTSIIAEKAKISKEDIDPTMDLEIIGLDSIMVNKINIVLGDELGDLPKTLLYEYQSIRAIAAYLMENHIELLMNKLKLKKKDPPCNNEMEEQSESLILPQRVEGSLLLDKKQRESFPQLGREDIAIIGVDGRYPGAQTLNQFWENLMDGKDSVNEIPMERWQHSKYFHPNRKQKGTSYAKWGGFIDDVDKFDALFFNISPREAETMDPQERLFLETAWNALEDAGYTKHTLITRNENSDRKIGVFVGVSSGQYHLYSAESWANREFVPAYSSSWSIPNRVSYTLNLTGPSLAIDTACSASLTAIHMACESIRRGESSIAIAGGVNFNIHPAKYVALSDMQFLSSDGKCRAFGANGDGYVPGEGVGAVILKPLSKAIEDGDNIYAVIKGTAMNHGGKTNGYTVPSPQAQANVIREALNFSGVDASTISYVEAHGTGTSLGDPIEIAGLTKALDKTSSCAVGSVKSNIGHLEPAAGIASLTKVILQLKHHKLVPSLHSEELNPNIDFSNSPFYVCKETTDWTSAEPEIPLRAMISSFGAGGSNANVVLEEYLQNQELSNGDLETPEAIILSARDHASLRVLVQKILTYAQGKKVDLKNLVYTLQTGRESFEKRVGFIIQNKTDLLEKLTYFLDSNYQSSVLYQGEVNNHLPSTNLNEVLSLLRAKEWEKLLALWVKGHEIPWENNYRSGERCRISLPTYPFQRKQYWLPKGYKQENFKDETNQALHPPMDRVLPSMQKGTNFERTIQADEPIVADHLVGSIPVLPGVAHLEMVRAASEVSSGKKVSAFEDITWISPIEVKEESEKVSVRLKEVGDDILSFELNTREKVRSKGQVKLNKGNVQQPQQRIDIQAIKARCKRNLTKKQVYEAFEEQSLSYGEYFQSLDSLWFNEEEVLGKVVLTKGSQKDEAGYILHPALLDGALHALTAFRSDSNTSTSMVPFCAKRMEIYDELTDACFVYARRSKASTDNKSANFNIAIVNGEGIPIIKITDFCARIISRQVDKVPKKENKDIHEQVPADIYYHPIWQEAPYPQKRNIQGQVLICGHTDDLGIGRMLHEYFGSQRATLIDLRKKPQIEDWKKIITNLQNLEAVYFLGGISGSYYSVTDLKLLEEMEELGTIALFRLLKALGEKARNKTYLCALTNNLYSVTEKERPFNAFAGSIEGLVRTASKEFHRLTAVHIDVLKDDVEELTTLQERNKWISHLMSEQLESYEFGIAWRGKKRFVKRLAQSSLQSSMPSDNPNFRAGGVYLLAGGTGGIGMVIGNYLASHYGARLILIGRSELNHEKKQKIIELERSGATVRYIQADMADEEAMQKAVEQTRKEFGTINGVIHTALVLQDCAIQNLEEKAFRNVLAPKITGTVVLNRVLESEALDFMVFFSSSISFTASAGQSSYVAGCTFKDNFAQYLCKTKHRWVRIFNWGFWGDAGIVSTEYYRNRMENLGVFPVGNEEGVEAFKKVMHGKQEQVMIIKLNPDRVHDLGIEINPSKTKHALHAATTAGIQFQKEVIEEGKDLGEEALHLLETIGREKLFAYFQKSGLFNTGEETYTYDELKRHLDIAPIHDSLFKAILNILSKAGFIHFVTHGVQVSSKVQEMDLSKRLEYISKKESKLVEGYPDVAGYHELLVRCMNAYPQVLTNKVPAVDILFPKGDTALLDSIYRGNRRADYFNQLISRAIIGVVQSQSPSRTLKILEVGAGTGGTSSIVLNDLKPYESNIEYVYTDISPQLVRTGKQRFSSVYSNTKFKVLNIEKDIETQGFKDGEYDIILATNVLHATKDIRATISQLRKLLNNNGLIAINELTYPWDFATLTFGLTEGWWLFKDSELRIEDSPLLNVKGWRELLESEGFHSVQLLGLPSKSEHNMDQSIILAENIRDKLSDKTTKKNILSTGGIPATNKPPESFNSNSEKLDSIVKSLVEIITHVVKMNVNDLEVDVEFDRYGIDSLVALDIIAELENDYNKLPRDLLFKYTTVESLAKYLMETYRIEGSVGILHPENKKELLKSKNTEPGYQSLNNLVELFAKVIKTDPEDIETNVNFDRYGIDSLVAMDIINELETQYGNLPKNLLFEYTSMDSLSKYLNTLKPEEVTTSPIDKISSIEKGSPFSEIAEKKISTLSQTIKQYNQTEADNNAIAIIGISGRFPGAPDLESLWTLLRDKKSGITEVPQERWDYKVYYDPTGQEKGTSYGKWGGFLEEIDRFDPLFFGIAPREALQIDPQERLFLQVSWEAVENAGYTRASLKRHSEQNDGAGVGVFVGAMYAQYQILAAEEWGRGNKVSAHSAYWSIANRVSHVLDLCGPSIAVDTACSSSLTAIHLACESIRRGDCSAAIAGGVNLILHPSHGVGLSKMKMLSHGSQCQVFGDEADGLVPGEGVGAVLLKPLKDAVRDGDHIHGVIKASSVNSDGRGKGYTVPNPESQAKLIQKAIKRANIDKNTISYVEAQAVGSAIGDKAEISALKQVFANSNDNQFPLRIGSVKPNIGHLEAASGMAQLAKVLLQMKHQQILPTLLPDNLNPEIDFDDVSFKLQDELGEWETADAEGPKRAVINSFGAGGANTHLIIEESPLTKKSEGSTTRPYLVILSAQKEDRLEPYVKKLQHSLQSYKENQVDQSFCIENIAYTLCVGREPMKHRLAWIVNSLEELHEALDCYLIGENHHSLYKGQALRGNYNALLDIEQVRLQWLNGELEKIAEKWVMGRDVEWEQIFDKQDYKRVALPSYPFRGEQYWIDSVQQVREESGTKELIATFEYNDTDKELIYKQDKGGLKICTSENEDHSQFQLHKRVQETILKIMVELLAVRREDIDVEENLGDYGFDSISLTEFSSQISEKLSIDVSPTMFFEHNNIQSVTEYLINNYRGQMEKVFEITTYDKTHSSDKEVQNHYPEGEFSRTFKKDSNFDSSHNDIVDGVAVVGISGIFPGASDLNTFWNKLVNQESMIEEIPSDRFDWHEIYGDPLREEDKTNSKWGGFIDQVDCFDAEFFKISPREASLMDPQQRLFLQEVWKAFEDAGYSSSDLSGSSTGVFVGVAGREYAHLIEKNRDEIDGQAASGTSHSILANRVSYLLNLRGPSEPVDTACSSSLVAVHRAVTSIQSGECDMAVAGGVNLLLTPSGFLAFGKSGMLSDDGKCKTFDESADGYVRGEGVGAVILKPLKKAILDGDNIYGVIRGSAVNHGGRANSLTAPNPTAQAEVIEAAIQKAGFDSATITYVEAHGTGTSLGDPIEVNGLKKAFTNLSAGGVQEVGNCGLGTVKTNIGHLETAAGIAGLIKVLLAMKHARLPGLVNFKEQNQKIQLEGSPFYLVKETQTWKKLCNELGHEIPRRAGISSFGFGGVNTHIVIEEFESEPSFEMETEDEKIFILSARDITRLQSYAKQIIAWLERHESDESNSKITLSDIAYTLQIGRDAMDVRLAIVAKNKKELLGHLNAFVSGPPESPHYFTGNVTEHREILGLLNEDLFHRSYLAELVKKGQKHRIAALWAKGYDVEWKLLHVGNKRRRVSLPAYPFAKERYWVKTIDKELNTSRNNVIFQEENSAVIVQRTKQVERKSSVNHKVAEFQVVQADSLLMDLDDPKSVADKEIALDMEGSKSISFNLTVDQLQEELKELFADYLNLEIKKIKNDVEFTSYGVDSIAGLRIMQKVQDRYGDDIPMLAIIEHPTIKRFAKHIIENYLSDQAVLKNKPIKLYEVRETDENENLTEQKVEFSNLKPTPSEAYQSGSSNQWSEKHSLIVPFQPKGKGEPLFGVHGNTGEVSWLIPVVSQRGEVNPTFGIEALGFDGKESHHSIEEMAMAYALNIKAQNLAVPIVLTGYGIGSIIAMETARLLEEQGQKVSRLILVEPAFHGTILGKQLMKMTAEDPSKAMTYVVNSLGYMWDCQKTLEYQEVLTWPNAEQNYKAAEYLAKNAKVPLPKQKLAKWIEHCVKGLYEMVKALASYKQVPYEGEAEVYLIKCQQDDMHRSQLIEFLPENEEQEKKKWKTHFKCSSMIHEVPYGHLEILNPVALTRVFRHMLSPKRQYSVDFFNETEVNKNMRNQYLVPINKNGTQRPAFWIHTLLGDVSYVVNLSRYLGVDYPIYGLEQYDSDGDTHLLQTIEEMAKAYIKAMREVQQHGPYIIGGYSFGGIIAYEMARQLIEEGEEPPQIIMIDSLLPGTGTFNAIDTQALGDVDFSIMALILIGNTFGNRWGAEQYILIDDIVELDKDLQIKLVAKHLYEAPENHLDYAELLNLVSSNYNTITGNNNALLEYKPAPLGGEAKALLFHATLGFVGPNNPNDLPEIGILVDDRTNGFGDYVGKGIEVYDLPADHYTICHDEFIKDISKKSKDWVKQADKMNTFPTGDKKGV
ncbi:SDR family NAD(P)-dependent oxidoreductase [Bacillus atrophaeus]|uniref:SDR family NAD(P)-dependent oxidoreductase n=1 Tax=Bacillus atrophaeus TaxID=1452 RepID=UPI000B92A0B0|nr:SDR family NAD(P)-dependent oxidoreductase [Bacillus atrophaeus]ASS71460.1 hypothetical protein BaGK_11120 [Bacillus atrophaeus]